EFDYGYTRYEWPNTGDRDISENRAFGGWVAGFSDHIVSITMASALAEGEWFTTMELQTRILRPVGHGLITIEGRLVSRGRTTGLVEAEWKDTNGRLLAKITAAKAIRTRDELGQPAISK
ncbi:MAG TPA: PaaI family thioesterase, partial [Hyphomonas sp.]|nr:PaaI family thioesterase [Hyphomonas sp.]